MVKVTIGVPVYNSEKFIKQGLDSFANQTMDKKDYEVLCVDDCSTDNSVEIINSYNKKMNVRVLQLPENSGGPGAPRNKVIEEAKGEYIFFVDSDDYIHENSLTNMYNFAKENEADVLLVKMKGINGRGVPQSMFKATEPNVDLYDSRLIYTLSPTKLFKTALLRENNISFPVGLKAAEDQIFTMRAYLKSKVISVLSNQDYYYATLREGEHMNNAYVDPEEFLKIMSDIVDEIYLADETRERKNNLVSSFLDRHFIFSRTHNFSIKNTTDDQKEEWMRALSNFLNNHVPKEVDSLTAADVYPRIVLARNQDLEKYQKFEMALKTNEVNTVIDNGQIFAHFNFLGDYPEVTKVNFTKLNKMVHKLKHIKLGHDRIIFTCQVSHSKLTANQNKKQKINAVFVHRDKKEEKYITPVVRQPLTQNYTFEVPYDGLINSKGDLGTWDLFIESEVEGFMLRGRIGNNREKYPYQAETSYLGSHHLFNYRLTPYFTKPHNNFSIYTRELEALEKKGKFEYDKKTNQLLFKYPEFNLVLPVNTVFTFETKSGEYDIWPQHIKWGKEGTTILMESSLATKLRDFRGFIFSSAKLNGIPIK
ncbi:glycosyltransferase [Bacillus firmus]|uniref:glycosyltransferase n=1 Tax=Cytobacillus firmus TaxID=1399 RepID=UPI001580BF8E|nr:glycosyltransferase [Cytobacillus firmus]NUH85490.1 glycosyltransferase [Cytobacillus firmus]